MVPGWQDVAMGAAIGLRAATTEDPRNANQSRRLRALAEIYDCGSRCDAARIGSVGLQIVRDWGLRFNSRGPEGLIEGKAPGARAKLDDAQRQALAVIVESGTIPSIQRVVRCRLSDLARWLHAEFRVSLDETTVSRQLKKLGYVKLTARPRHHAQDTDALEAFKKGFTTELEKVRAGLPQDTAIEVWFQDEARVGQKNKITRRSAKRGTRPSAPHDQRTISSYIFGAICPALGKGPGLVWPVCNIDAMTLHLAEIARTVAPSAHAVVLMDHAGWDMTVALVIPESISIIPLPAKCGYFVICVGGLVSGHSTMAPDVVR
ncbi:IS630 family transposase [Marivita cryptomonadis]|uniref:IS630 family transposase n=1 Tax=Marivita cryptomonadis TaxID=505252 RepID=UPI000A1F18AD|nr:IS630 family transposase [Marivita cryptomonadis]